MIKKIKFFPSNQLSLEEIPPPEPIKLFLPDWYKQGETFLSSSGEKIKKRTMNSHGGMKSCIPFLDSMMSGYAITSWQDIYIKTSSVLEEIYPVNKSSYNEEYLPDENSKIEMIGERKGDIGYTIPRPQGHCENHMVFHGQWGVRLPKGWSLLVTHPFNRFDLPFTTTSGVIDSDEWWPGGNIPFFIKNNYEGVIPKGTPFAQLVPIKRSSWISSVSKLSIKRNTYLSNKARSQIGWYKKNIWVKKDYE